MNRKFSTLVLIFLLLIAKISATEFGIGGVFSMTNSFTQVGFSAGLSMGFHTRENPVIWEMSVGSSNKINEEYNPFVAKMRFDWHVVNWSVDSAFAAFFGPGLGFEFQTGNDAAASAQYKKDMMGLTSIVAFRIVGGFKLFATREVEFFMSIAPELGVMHRIAWATDNSGTIKTNFPQFYWSFETSLGIRFWMP